VSELIGDLAGREGSVVQDGRGGLPEVVRRDPGETVGAARVPDVASDVGRVPEASQGVRKLRLVQAGAGREARAKQPSILRLVGVEPGPRLVPARAEVRMRRLVFERFTDRARRVVVLAQEEARSFGHNHIGTEHLLLGLIKEGDGLAANALGNLGISLDLVQGRVGETIGQASKASADHIPFSPHAKQVLELSLREMEKLGDTLVGTQHILLGLISVSEGVAAQTLLKLRMDPDRVRQEVLHLRIGGSESWFA
jgi:Clp amino terminal domain, pathogenicity island component